MIWTVIEWVSTVTSFGGTLAVAYHQHWGWIFGIIADFGFVVFAVNKKLWGFFSLCFGYMIVNLVGWLN